MSNNIKRVQVNFTKEQYDILQKLKGELGNSDSAIVKNITIAWLSEKSLIPSNISNNIFKEIYNEKEND